MCAGHGKAVTSDVKLSYERSWALAADAELEQIDPAHLPAVLEGLAQAKAGQYASVAEVEAAFRRFDS